MWSVADAQRLQNRAREQAKVAAGMPTAELRREALSFTVCGGGATGVEVVGTLGQLLPKRAAEVGLDPGDLNIHLVEGRPDILYDLRAPQRAKARARLAKMGVEVVTGSMVERVNEPSLTLADGREVPAATLVWCGGAKADPHAAGWGFSLDNVGRIPVDPDSKADGLRRRVRARRRRGLPRPQGQPRPADARSVRDHLGRARHRQHPVRDRRRHHHAVRAQPARRVRERRARAGAWAGCSGSSLSGFPAIFMKRLTYVLYWWQVGGVKLAWKRGRELLAMQR